MGWKATVRLPKPQPNRLWENPSSSEMIIFKYLLMVYLTTPQVAQTMYPQITGLFMNNVYRVYHNSTARHWKELAEENLSRSNHRWRHDNHRALLPVKGWLTDRKHSCPQFFSVVCRHNYYSVIICISGPILSQTFFLLSIWGVRSWSFAVELWYTLSIRLQKFYFKGLNQGKLQSWQPASATSRLRNRHESRITMCLKKRKKLSSRISK
jgi:hypothetical protein